MKKLEPKFIALHEITARLDQRTGHQQAPMPDGVEMTIPRPSVVLETEDGGTSHSPAESVEVFGAENLLKLAHAIYDFCGKNGQAVEEHKAGKEGVAV